MLGVGPDQPGANHGVILVEHGGLAGRDAVDRRVELEAKAVLDRLDACGDGLGAVAQPDVRSLDRDMKVARHVDGRTSERLVRADDDSVRARDRAHRVQRPRRGDSQALPLAWGEAPVAGVAAKLATLLVDDRAFDGIQATALEERAVVVAREEACLLALAPRRDGETRSLGLRACLTLRLLAEREDNPLEVTRVETREHVRLVLLRVGGAREEAPSAMLHDARVVARGELVRTGAPCELE